MAVQIKFSKKHKIKEDKFLEALIGLREKFELFKKPIMFTVGGLVVAGIIFFLSLNVKSKTNDEAGSLLGKAVLEYRAGKFSSSVSFYKKIITDFGSTNHASKASFLLGNLYYELGNYSLAVETYKEYIEKYSETDFLNVAVYKGLGSSYVQLKNYKSAVSAYNTAIKKFPNVFSIPEIHYKLAQCYLENKNKTSAGAELKKIISNFPDSNYANKAELILVTL